MRSFQGVVARPNSRLWQIVIKKSAKVNVLAEGERVCVLNLEREKAVTSIVETEDTCRRYFYCYLGVNFGPSLLLTMLVMLLSAHWIIYVIVINF